MMVRDGRHGSERGRRGVARIGRLLGGLRLTRRGVVGGMVRNIASCLMGIGMEEKLASR